MNKLFPPTPHSCKCKHIQILRFTDLAKSLQSYLPQSLGGTTTDQVGSMYDNFFSMPYFSKISFTHMRKLPKIDQKSSWVSFINKAVIEDGENRNNLGETTLT